MPDGSAATISPNVSKHISVTVTFHRERLADICCDMGPLMRRHDREIWPGRKWGPRNRVKFNLVKYLSLEAQGILHVIAARCGGRLVGYCLEALEIDDHYGVRGAINCGIFLHPDYRGGKGLSIRRSPGFRMIQEREKLLDDAKAERRRIGVKMWKDFGAILRLFGYEPDMMQYQKICTHQKDE